MSISSSAGDTYHHGDLRNALIEAGVKMLETDGAQGLSMRKLAKQAGVSHNAPYMHFADKEALLAAIAEEGFHILAAAVSDAIARAGDDWQQQLLAGSWAYVDFALAHPNHLQVMFREYDPEKYPSLYAASIGSLELLRALIEQGQLSELVISGDSQELATFIWSLLHGVSTILAGRKLPPTVMGTRTPEELVRAYVGLLYRGVGTNERVGN